MDPPERTRPRPVRRMVWQARENGSNSDENEPGELGTHSGGGGGGRGVVDAVMQNIA